MMILFSVPHSSRKQEYAFLASSLQSYLAWSGAATSLTLRLPAICAAVKGASALPAASLAPESREQRLGPSSSRGARE